MKWGSLRRMVFGPSRVERRYEGELEALRIVLSAVAAAVSAGAAEHSRISAEKQPAPGSDFSVIVLEPK